MNGYAPEYVIIPHFEKDAQKILDNKSNNYNKAVELMSLYCYAVSTFLLYKRQSFEEELSNFVDKEQQKIDNILSK